MARVSYSSSRSEMGIHQSNYTEGVSIMNLINAMVLLLLNEEEAAKLVSGYGPPCGSQEETNLSCDSCMYAKTCRKDGEK